jgi:hypothetical protein
VHIEDRATGRRKRVRRDQLTGIDDFANSLRRAFDVPPEMRFQGWQGSDENHAPGSGRPAYRVVYKTLRTVPTHPAAVVAANCRVMFANDRVTWGEPRFGRALPWRRPDRFLVPDWGRVFYNPVRYVREADDTIPMEAHQETTPPMNYVEVLYVFNEIDAEGGHSDRLAAARAAISTLLASLDLVFGPRLLGLRITEEIGEVFDDWHWNRRLDGPTVALEAQAQLEYVDADAAMAQIGAVFDANAGRSEEDRARLRIASQWYWRADAETDPVQAFIAHWLTIETLEMNGTNIAPLKDAVHALVGGPREQCASAVGRLQGLRSRLVHGKTRSVSSNQIDAVRSVSSALLERRLLGVISEARRTQLRGAVADASQSGF